MTSFALFNKYYVFDEEIREMMFLHAHKNIELEVCREKFEIFLKKHTRDENIEEIDLSLMTIEMIFRVQKKRVIKGILKIVTDRNIIFAKIFKGPVSERTDNSDRYCGHFVDTIKLTILEELKKKLLQCKEEKEKKFLEDINQVNAMSLVNKNFYQDFLNFIGNKIFDNNKQPDSSYEKLPNILRKKIFEDSILENCQRIREKFQRNLTR